MVFASNGSVGINTFGLGDKDVNKYDPTHRLGSFAHRRIAIVAVQQRLGLLPLGRPRLGGHHSLGISGRGADLAAHRIARFA
jgi:hypothetical protein